MVEYSIVHGLNNLELHEWEHETDLRLPLIMAGMWCLIRLGVYYSWEPEAFKKLEKMTVQTLHAKLLSNIHAVGACVFGAWFVWGGELDEMIQKDRLFGFNEFYAMSSLFGISYFMYDFIWLLAKSYMFELPIKDQIGILGHHLLFIGAFWIATGFPCLMAAIAYSFFQMTELSTIFLNNHYVFIKLGIEGKPRFINGLLLLGSFLIRVILTSYVTYITTKWFFFGTGDYFPTSKYMPLATMPVSYTSLDKANHVPFNGSNQILDMTELPLLSSYMRVPFIFLFGIGCPGMLILNMYWFVLLLRKAINTPHAASEHHAHESKILENAKNK